MGGDIKMTGYTERNAYTCGEDVMMVTECENNLSDPIVKVSGEFVQKLRIKCKHLHQTTEEKYEGPSGGEIPPGGKAVGENAMRVGCSSEKATVKKHKDGRTTYNTTCKGKLIDCDYFVQVKFTPGTCCNCSAEPHVRFPVHMTVPFVQYVPVVMQGWGDNVTQVQPFTAQIDPNNIQG